MTELRVYRPRHLFSVQKAIVIVKASKKMFIHPPDNLKQKQKRNLQRGCGTKVSMVSSHKYPPCVCVLALSLTLSISKCIDATFSRPSISLLLLFHVQEDDAEEEETAHHGEDAGVVRVGGWNEALVLRVLQRTHGHLRGRDIGHDSSQ